jgi:integrase/recombinase XerD
LNDSVIQTLENPNEKLFIAPPGENLSSASLEAYRSDRVGYLQFCHEQGLAIGDTASLETYRDALIAASLKPSSVNRKVYAVKKGLVGYIATTYGKEKAEILKQAYKSVKAVKLAQNEKVVRSENILNEDEIERLIAAADLKTALIILFLSKTGCRISEALNLKLDNIVETDDAMELTVIGKGMKARTVFLSKDDYQMIRSTFNGQTYLFETIHGNRYDKVNVSKKVGKLSKTVLGKHSSAHTFRHSFATNKIRETRKIQAVSQYLGHASVSITLDMYTHETLSLDELL